MNRQTKPMTTERALAKLEEQCARAEHSTGELREKLRRWCIAQTDADKIIERLVETRFVNDRRFAESYVRDKVKFARWGRRKIAQGLYTKHVSNDIIKSAIEHIDEDEYADNLRHLIEIKIKNTPSLLESYEGRTKIYRFLISRGYEPGLSAEMLRKALT